VTIPTATPAPMGSPPPPPEGSAAQTHAPAEADTTEPDVLQPTQDSHHKRDILSVVGLVVLGGLAFGVLFFASLPEDMHDYFYVNYIMKWTFTVFNLAIMAYASVVLVMQLVKMKREGPDAAAIVTLGARLLVIVGSVIYTLTPLMVIDFRVSGIDETGHGSYAEMLWNLPRIGGGWMLIISILLHCLAGYFLIQYKAPNPVLAYDRRFLPTRQKRMEEAQEEFDNAAADQAAYRRTIDDMQPELARLSGANATAVEETKAAQKVFDEHSAVVELATTVAGLKANEQMRAAQLLDIQQYEAQIPAAIRTTVEPKEEAAEVETEAVEPETSETAEAPVIDLNADAVRIEMLGQLKVKKLALTLLQNEQSALEARKIELEAVINEKVADDGSGEDGPRAILDAVIERGGKVADELKAANEAQELATKELDKAGILVAAKGHKLEMATTKHTDTLQRIHAATTGNSNVWRDALVWVFWAIVVLFAAFHLADPIWYGLKLHG